jgi:L-iditol 2-dehydrogenase
MRSIDKGTSDLTHTAALLYGARDLRLESVPTPAPQSHQILIRPRATGLCGTDNHYYYSGKNGIFTITDPLVLGHEAAGEVIEVGSDAASFGLKPGDRVAVEPQRLCGQCKLCKDGKYNLCPSLKFTGSASASPPVPGSLQEKYVHEAAFVHHLPENVSWEEGAMVEPLSVAIHAVRRSRLRAGQSILVLGAGAIGLLCASVARVSGAKSISMVDIDEARLSFALKQGLADAVFQMPLKGQNGESREDFTKRVATEMLRSKDFERTEIGFDCTGIETCVNVAIYASAPGGKVVLVGMGSPVQSVHVGAAAVREVDLVAVWRYANTFPIAIDMIASGKVNVKNMVTHSYPLKKAAQALDLVVEKPPDLIKCVITG